MCTLDTASTLCELKFISPTLSSSAVSRSRGQPQNMKSMVLKKHILTRKIPPGSVGNFQKQTLRAGDGTAVTALALQEAHSGISAAIHGAKLRFVLSSYLAPTYHLAFPVGAPKTKIEIKNRNKT